MSSRSRYGRNICFVSVPFYFFAITLFSTFSASCTPRSRNRFTRMSDEWWWRACRQCRDTMSTWQNRKMEEGRVVVCTHICQTLGYESDPGILVGNIFALRCSKRAKRIEPLLLPWKHRRNACSCNGIETKSRWNEADSGFDQLQNRLIARMHRVYRSVSGIKY